MTRKVLLIEPDYTNKYPPLGLMKISKYHKMLGDEVTFYKGLSPELRAEKWDRIYVTTLFSFFWSRTIKTIMYYKRSVHKTKDFYIGGILATTMKDEIFKETGLMPYAGLLDKPGILDDNNDIIVDEVTPDYDLLDETDYSYGTSDAYFTYMTRGCVNKCPFCAVPMLEPNYKHFMDIKNQINEVDQFYGQRRNLVLMDNNVLGSDKFDEIIDIIKELGFEKGAKYKEPNLFELWLKRLRVNSNDKTAIRNLKKYVKEFPKSRLSNNPQLLEKYQSIIDSYSLHDDSLFSSNILEASAELSPIIEKYRNKTWKQRYVDFNQGLDARLLTEEKVKKLSEININPLRIAFDDIKLSQLYVDKVKLAAKYGLLNLSNYILYNYNDKPEDLYNRLKINIDLNNSLGTKIYSFPMKYIPINSKDRKYVGKHWNPKYIRSIQAVLNVIKGSVMPGKEFFEKAFGSNIEEFKKILLMPEDYIIYRFENERNGNTDKWWKSLNDLNPHELEHATDVIKANNFNNLQREKVGDKVYKVLEHYVRKR
jgi:hypothetical protein